MAKQTINIGTSANKGDGEPLRTAFDKINDNFDELYLRVGNLETGTVTTGDIKGSVFGDDSTLLVDGVNSTIPSANLSGALPAIDGSALTGITSTTLGGQNASYYLDYNNFTNTPTIFSGAFADLTGKPTTIAGYGISDAFDGVFASLTSKPTTIVGYGITDALATPGDNIALGTSSSAGTEGVGIGKNANAGNYAQAIGNNAGNSNQGQGAVALGSEAGESDQGNKAVAIGNYAGETTQGANAIAIGEKAGQTNQAANSIVLNATGAALENTTSDSMVVKPIRNASGTHQLEYNPTTGEVTYDTLGAGSSYTDGNVDVHLNQSTAGPNQVLSWTGSDYAWVAQSGGGGGTGDTQGSVFGDDSTLLVDGVNSTINSSALTKPIALADNEKITFGTDDDLEIFHNASNGNTIIDNNTGNLVIKGSNLFLQSATSEYFFRGAANGAVTIYHDNVAKFETTADGVSVTDHIALADNGEVRLGTDNDMQISHSGISGLIKSTTGSLVLQSGTVRIQDGGSSQTAFSASNGIATLLFENSAKLATTTNGVTITGDTTVSGNLVAGTGTVGGLTFAGTQIASDDSTQISFQDNIEIAGGPIISGSNLSHTGTFTINPYALNITTTGGNVHVQASNYVILDSTNNGQINIGQASGSGDVLIGNESNGTSISLEGHTRIEAGVEESFTKLTGQSGVVAHDCSNGYMFYHTGMTGDITANFTNLSLASGHATNLTVVIDQGGTEYEITAVQIGGAAQTIVWQNNNAPTGTANGVDSFSFTILNDGGSYVVLGQMVSFGGV